MDDSQELVRRIAGEVMQRLQQQPEPAASSGRSPRRPGTTGKSLLVLLTGGDRDLDEVLVQTGRLTASAKKARVVLSASAQKLIGVPAVRRAAPEAEVLTEGDVFALLREAQLIVLPNMSLNAASKIACLMPDSLVCILAVYGLLSGIPLLASRDSLLPVQLQEGALPPAARKAIDDLSQRLEAMGVQLFHLQELTASGGQKGQGERAKKPSSCTLAAAGECSECGQCVEHRPGEVQQLVESGASRVGAASGSRPAADGIARLIDHTLLKPDATEEQIKKLCQEALEFSFASVCVNPSWVPLAAKLLEGSLVKVCTVIGFPLGATTPTTKAIETRDAIANGAREIDMVINVGALKSGDDQLVLRDIEAVVAAARGQALVKVILDTALLTKEEIVKACLLAKRAGADFVKTSTGFGGGGATVEDIALMRQTVGEGMGVKASGGIRDRKSAEALVAAGASRIGASASVAIATGKAPGGQGY